MTKTTEQSVAERGAAISKAMKAFVDAYAVEVSRRGAEFARELNAAMPRRP